MEPNHPGNKQYTGDGLFRWEPRYTSIIQEELVEEEEEEEEEEDEELERGWRVGGKEPSWDSHLSLFFSKTREKHKNNIVMKETQTSTKLGHVRHLLH